MKNLLLATSLLLSQNLLASEQCTKEMQNKINKILKICKTDDGSKVCDLRLSSNCQKVLDDVNTKLITLNKSIHDELMSADLDSATAVKKINQDINMSFKVAATLSTPSQAREMKVQQEKILCQFQRMLKKDSQFLTRVHPNGMTSREMYRKFQDASYQLGVAQAFKTALEKTKNNKNFDKNFIEAFTSDPELKSIYASKSLDNKGRMVAGGDGFGLYVYTCNEDRNSNLSFHAVIYGLSRCHSKSQSELIEHTIGAGAFFGGLNQALICIAYGDRFNGVGINAALGVMLGSFEIGTYIGVAGTCLKVNAHYGVGAKVGIGYISAKNPTFSSATNAFENSYKQEIVEIKE